MTPGRFLSTPSLWIGLVFAALFLAAAVRCAAIANRSNRG